jgi:hypothetical protein
MKAKRKNVPKFHFTPEQEEYLRENYAHTGSGELAAHFGCKAGSIYRKATALGLKKTHSFLSEQTRRRASVNYGFLKNSFKKGHVPQTRGKKAEEFLPPEALARFREAQFKKGNKPLNTLHDGAVTIRRDKNGWQYRYIRIAEGQWEALHRHIWEQHYGAIPPGGNIVFRDGNSLNCRIENLECISCTELGERNRISGYPAELQTAIKTKNKIIRKIKKYGKKQD